MAPLTIGRGSYTGYHYISNPTETLLSVVSGFIFCPITTGESMCCLRDHQFFVMLQQQKQINNSIR